MKRAPRILLPLAALACLSVPLAAQGFSEGFIFLKAVRDRDGAKVTQIASSPSSAAINAREPGTGEGALHIVVSQRNLEFLAYLLGHGARPDIQSNDGTTPLAQAARIGWADGARQLLARGARVDLANQRGETPLILAVQAQHLAVPERLMIIRLLLEGGADPRKQDNFAGYSALDYARQDRRAPEIARALEETSNRAVGPMVGPNP